MKKENDIYYDEIGRLVKFVGFWPDGEEKEIVLQEADGTCAFCGMVPTPGEMGCEKCDPDSWL